MSEPVEYLTITVPRPRLLSDATPTEREDWHGDAMRAVLAGLGAWCAGARLHTEPVVSVDPDDRIGRDAGSKP